MPRLTESACRGFESLFRHPRSPSARSTSALRAVPEAPTLTQDDRGVDEGEVREGLWEVPELAPRDRIVFLRQQPYVVSQVQKALEELSRLFHLSLKCKHIREPEGAREILRASVGHPCAISPAFGSTKP